MNKLNSKKRNISIRTLLFLISLSLTLFVISFVYFIFVNHDQINKNLYYIPEGVVFTDLTTITKKQSWHSDSQGETALLAKKIVKQDFIAVTDNLGTIAIPFETHKRSIDERIIFRLKETGSKNWYYENIYSAQQFQNNAPFPFGFPVITNSKNKSYTFQIEALDGKPNNSISLNKTDTYFFSKYKFSKTTLKNPHTLLQFLTVKIETQMSSITIGDSLLIFLVGISPLIFYYFRYKNTKRSGWKHIISFNKYSIFKNINTKKFIFYAATILGLFLFFINGLITRGNSFYNLFSSDNNGYFMDFFNVLYSLFNGPYTYNSIYPPLPLFIYKILARLVPYGIVAQGPLAIRSSQLGQIVLLLYILITLSIFLVLLLDVKKGSKIEKYLFAFIILLSAPFLHQFERANIIFVALSFLMIFVFFKDSKNRIVREFALISLAISGAIKLYPVIFGLLLVKEKRYRDIYRVLIYGLIFLILPFFALGGINQLPLLINNLFSTSDSVTSWGVGYAVNLQNITRTVFGFFGNFGESPIAIGRFISFVLLILGLVVSFLLHSKWKVIAIITLLMILVPAISYEYVLIFMVIPLIMFLDSEDKDKWDNFYAICFSLIFIPFTFGRIDFINRGFGGEHILPLTYSVLIQDFALLAMTGCLIYKGLIGSKLKSVGKLLPNFRLKIFHQSSLKKLYYLIPLLVIFIYNAISFNKYLPLTEGWFSTYAWLFNHGQFPYKDFYLFLPPLYLLNMSAFTAIFGYGILPLRIFGIGVILLMTYFLYKNLEIIFGPAIAAFVGIVGMIYYQSGVAHITYDFTQFVTLYALIQSYFLLKYINLSEKKRNISIKWVFWAGLFAGLTFLTKQSNGLLITAFSFAGLLFLSLTEKKRVFSPPLLYILGFAVPVGLTALWLLSNSAFSQFFQQIFLDAVSTKGGLLQIFFGWFKTILTVNFIIKFIVVFLIISLLGYPLYFFTQRDKENEEINTAIMFVASLFSLLVVFLPFLISRISINQLSELGTLGTMGQQGISVVIVAAISIPIISVLTSIIFLILRKPFNKSIFLFSFVALGFIYGTGTSAGISEAGAFAGFCLFIALMLHFRSFYNLGKIFIILFCLSLCLVLIEKKYENPYSWWNVTSTDIRGELYSTNKIQILYGMQMSAENKKMVEGISSEISSNTKPGDTILLFPNIPLFYLLTDRKMPGKALVYWFDFLPDNLAIKEAELIRKNPPKVIVYLDLGPSVWEAHENLFRNGKPSGQRKIVESFMKVIESQGMHISEKYKLANNVNLIVWRK